MATIIDNEFEIGAVVYLKTDMDQQPRIVYGFKVFKNDILYTLACGTQSSDHYAIEIAAEKNILVSTST